MEARLLALRKPGILKGVINVVQGSKSEIIAKKLLDIANTIAEKYDTTPAIDLTSEKFFETNSEHEQQDNDNEEGNAAEIADTISGDLDVQKGVQKG